MILFLSFFFIIFEWQSLWVDRELCFTSLSFSPGSSQLCWFRSPWQTRTIQISKCLIYWTPYWRDCRDCATCFASLGCHPWMGRWTRNCRSPMCCDLFRCRPWEVECCFGGCVQLEWNQKRIIFIFGPEHLRRYGPVISSTTIFFYFCSRPLSVSWLWNSKKWGLSTSFAHFIDMRRRMHVARGSKLLNFLLILFVNR